MINDIRNVRNGVSARWWHDAVFYEIYVQSFYDSNGDGIGDLSGVTAKLDYLRELGVDCIWLSPIMASPFADCGYDSSDHYAINPDFGTFDDFYTLLREAHRRDMRVILDLVLGYTSDQHPWFQSARHDRFAPTRDFYVWAKGVDGGPPNNWFSSAASRPAWQYNEATDDYFYYAFLPEQPHLNWTNPQLEEEMVHVFTFWLETGIDGYRLDAINYLYADRELRNNPKEGFHQIHVADRNHRNVHRVLRRLRSIADGYDDVVLLGEVFPGDTTESKEYHGNGADELNLTFNFSFSTLPENTRWYDGESVSGNIDVPSGADGFSASTFRRLLTNYDLVYSALELWPTVVLGNHDQPRIYSIYAEMYPNHPDRIAKVMATYNLTAKGTPFLYAGEEIGMENMVFSDVSQFKDLFGVSYYHYLIDTEGLSAADALKKSQRVARDKCRTPMQWSTEANAGFSTNAETWQLVNPNYRTKNAAVMERGADSILQYYRSLIAMRRQFPVLRYGAYRWIAADSMDVIAYERTGPDGGVAVLLNLSIQPQTVNLGSFRGSVLLSNTSRKVDDTVDGTVDLEPVESLVVGYSNP